MSAASPCTRRGSRRRIVLAGAGAVAVLATTNAAAATVQPMASTPSPLVGMQDDRVIQADPLVRMRMMADAGARVARVDLRWDRVATRAPADASDPGDPAYDWTTYDQVVAAARRYRMEVLFTVWGTPSWAVDTALFAYGDLSYGTASFAPRDPGDLGRFAQAAARRYAPLGVHKWEGWNEPNVPMYLQPQYTRVNGLPVAASPAIYSGLQRAFYEGIKSIDPRSQVAGVVTSPAGNPGGLDPTRVVPMTFVRLLGRAGLRPPMDVVSHHPYPVRARTDKPTPPGRAYADLYNLRDMITAVDSTYLRGKKLWLTEYGFSTSSVPEYRVIVSPKGQAANIADAHWRLSTNRRVSMAVYYLLQDHPGWRSGLYTQNGAAKPGRQAYSLPMWARGRLVYGQVRNATGRTRVAIQQRRGNRWVTARTVTTTADGSFRVRVTGRAQLRAQWRGTARTGQRVTRISIPVRVTA